MARLNLTILLSVAMLLLMSLTPAIIYATSMNELNEENETLYPTSGRASHSVSIQNFGFSPSTLTIDVGDSVTWTNNDGSSHTASSTSGPVSFDSGTLSGGATFTFTFNTVGSYDYRCDFHSSMTATITVVATNSPPEVTGVTLSPDPAFTDDIISVSASTSDADGDPVTLSYSWSVNGNAVSETGSTLAGSTWFDKSDLIDVEVTPNDGTTDGTAVSSSGLNISNSAPDIASVAISPSPLNNESIATCSASGWADADGDAEGYQYTWMVNGASLQVTSQSTGPFNADDVVSCTVTPNDGEQSGTPVASSDVTVIAADATDADGDGVDNDDDLCPDTDSGESVDADGCTETQRDNDGDGVDNWDDLCPNTDPGVWANNDGCAENQLDDDGDGVSNADDDCGDTEEGASVDAGGCTDTQRGELDDDEDGVLNADDLCPNTDPDEWWVDENGCADSQLDNDGDGLSDSEDSCPDEDSTGYDNDGDGCLDDSDADGVTDDVDACPNTDSGIFVDENGCNDNQLDDDGDGIMNDSDICPGHDDSVDTDSDGEPDGCDADKDNDGVADGEWGDDAFPLDPTEWVDTDGDGTGDNADTDDDGDDVADSDDAFPLDATESADKDGDGIGDNADLDDDNDLVPDGDDDCPGTPNMQEVGDDGCELTQTDDSNSDDTSGEASESDSVPGFLGVFAISSLLVAAVVSRQGMSRRSQD